MAPQLRDHDRYDILGEHGRGGLGRVSRAHDRELGRDIAIKELISRGHLGEVRFLREALITARLEHPGIVPVYEAGRWADGTPFYAMKLVSGRPLRDLIAERMSVDERIGLLHHVIAVADAIAYAHGKNIIHRDLKPANVIVGDFGETVVIDWGLAKDISAAEEPMVRAGPFREHRDDGLTSAGTVLGTPAYMAPEQARGEPVDQRADVFAIGTMLWELCSLQKLPPNFSGQRRRILRESGIDADLITIVEKAVDPDSARRYFDAGDLAADLKAFKAGIRIAARRYSLWALLAHWTRRHRALATSAVVATALAVAGIALYVRNIAAAGSQTDRALSAAQWERDRAILSEAALLLEKDPARARDLLAPLALRSAQYALVLSRARKRASVRVMSFNEGIHSLLRLPEPATVALVMDNGYLYRADLHDGVNRLEARDLPGPLIQYDDELLFAHKPFGVRSSTIMTSSNVQHFDTSPLGDISALASANHMVYVLDASHDLYRVGNHRPVRVRQGVRGIAGDGTLLAVCALDGTFELWRDDTVQVRRRCAQVQSPEMMAVVKGDYATLTGSGVLTASRGGTVAEIKTELTDEYELALSSTGVIALADYRPGGSAWLIRRDGTRPELVPAHAGKLWSVAAGGNFAAWGYADGTVIALDTTTDTVWDLRGHPDGVTHMVVDDSRRTLVSSTGQQLRLWNLKSDPVTKISAMPCSTFNIQVSPDADHAALDCSDGSVWVWTRSAGTVARLHHHADLSFGVQWLRDMLCSSGWDGRVICSTVDGKTTRKFDSKAGRIMWLEASPQHDFLVLASIDGRIWKLDTELHELYAHGATPYRLAVAPRGDVVASCDLDGSLIVFDLRHDRIVARLAAHTAAIHSVSWLDDELWTSGVDGVLRRWWWHAGSLDLLTEAREPAPLRLTQVFPGGSAYNVGEGLTIRRAGAAVPLHLELARSIDAIDVSPDRRYVSASILGQVIIVDIRDNRIATVNVDSTSTGYVGFVDSKTLVVSATTALKTVDIDTLDYIQF
jgi:WD40 repeat protein